MWIPKLFRAVRVLAKVLTALTAIYLLVYLAHRPFRSAPATAPKAFEYLAHRGVHQNFPSENLDAQTCTATRIFPPQHALLENTLESMEAAFAAGADRVEIDLHLSRDNILMVFHDWTVDCRTEGHGETRRHSAAELKALDIGYGYTADGGRSFPFRGGKFVGAMSTFEEVLERFPQRKFLLDQKDRAPRTTHALVELLRIKHPGAIPNLCLQATPERNAQCVDSLLKACAWPEPPEVGQCLFGYLRAPWRTQVPSVCAGRTLFVPDRYASRLLWGWPGTFVERMHAAGSRVMVMTEDPQRAEHFRRFGFDGVWTNHIEGFAAASVPGAPRGPITN